MSNWCRQLNPYFPEITDESRLRGFGPLGKLTQHIRETGSLVVRCRVAGIPTEYLGEAYKLIADGLVG